jgi:hypothetical protein
VAFSAMHSARRSGKGKSMATGPSVPGGIENRISTPLSVSSWPVSVISRVGGIGPIEPRDVVWPSPAPICPRGPFSRWAPYIVLGPAVDGRTGVDALGHGVLWSPMSCNARYLGVPCGTWQMWTVAAVSCSEVSSISACSP